MEPPSGFSDHVGIEFTDLEAGYSQSTLTVDEHHHNPNAVVHGGVLYTMADTGMGAAMQLAMDEDQQCATIEVKISYLRPVRSGTVTCETTLLRKGRSVAYLESELTSEGDTVARASGSFAVFTPGE